MTNQLTEAQKKEFERNLKESHRIMKLRKELAEFMFFEEFYTYQLEQLRKKIQIESGQGLQEDSSISEQMTKEQVENIVNSIKQQVEQQRQGQISEQANIIDLKQQL
jgi:Zn-dependent oligopeptidase